MSEPLEAGYVEDQPQVYEGAAWAQEPIPVTMESERRTPELCSTMTWTIPQAGVGQPVQILQRTIHRFKAKLTITSTTGGATVQVVFSNILDRVQGASPQGAAYTPAAVNAQDFSLPDWESQQPCYAICIGGTATVAVQDERFLDTR